MNKEYLTKEEFNRILNDETENVKELVDYDEDSIMGIPLDNICFMKHYFKAKGYDPESEDFITDVLKITNLTPIKPLTYYYQDDVTNLDIKYTLTTSNKE